VSAGSLADILAAHAAALEGVVVRPGAGSREVMAGATLVAVLAPAAIELRLRRAVAAAALRTPDVEPSQRGPGWVWFAPPEVDDFARDRAIAWLESAVRLVTEGKPPD
jgi:hypothetical protein